MAEQPQMKALRDKIMVAQHSFEVRHEPSGSFLDVRGYVADYIRNNKYFSHWKIQSNVVNFSDTADKIKLDGAFAGYKSAGYFVYNPETRNYFVDKASSYWKALLKNEHYKIPMITRFGSRTLVFVPSPMKFNEINSLIFNNFFSEKVQTLIGGKETDLNFAINLNDGQFEVRLSGGPIHENEAANYLSFESEHFKKCGLFLDIDYYKTTSVDHSDVAKLLHEAVRLSWTKIETIANSLGL